ncbi:MarR family winged helix-turn-helix transcriptional regulator [Burkholderia ubonensis]|uniref:MarR family winged helix-turn-helix transcriptional regulator n=1 Tax=Burkholderia ubonensis TaxID=101571 RepID=UPI000753DB9C|nr:MarR family transcriptional regulator [Burkholderia ubonensis]KVA22268.1 MarR family transcriptional regulator [Burkholderia ubonensis]KVA23912.1 MarR family transcriptional regulator [Burkholderia ubonensis]KVA39580.1 MarR family transcriptional regulator [Burkholderia ubonensis]
MFFLKELPSLKVLETYRERFPAMNVDKVHAALHMLRRASQLMRELDNYFAEHELSTLRYLILVVLDREDSPDGLKASELADRIDVSRPVMTRTIQGMVDDGMLTYQSCEEDARAKLVSLTRSGRNKLNRVLPGYYQLIDRFMSNSEE